MKNEDAKLKSGAMSGIVWKFAEKIGIQGMQFIIQIVLARLLLPEDYGLVGLITVFITISDVFILQGFTTALIQKKNADETDFSSVFYANLIMAVVLYILLYFLWPGVAWFYNEPRLTELMRVLSLSVIAGAFSAVHNSIMSRNLEFKKSFLRMMANLLTQGIVGIGCAYMGFGVWSLVFSKLAGTLVGSVVICGTVRWRPKWLFSGERLKSLFSFSSKILGTNLLNTLFNNIHSILIGKFFAKAELGYYQRGQQIPHTMMTAVDGSLNEVLYPTLSKLQDDLSKVKAALRRSMKTSSFIMFPVLLGTVAVTHDLVLFLLTEKWLPCVPFMQLSCVVCMFWPFSARTHALNAIGESKVTFRLSLIGKSITLVLIAACIPFGIYAILLGTILASTINLWIVSHYVNKYIGYSIKEFLGDILPLLLLSAVMMVLVMGLGMILPLPVLLKLIVQVVFGIAVYVVLAKLFKVDSFDYLLNTVKKMLKK